MLPPSPIHFATPIALIAALIVWFATITIAWIRKIAARAFTRGLLAVGLLLLAIAAGDPIWHRPASGIVTVMVDLSPSTRGAMYRHRSALDRRIHELVGNTPFRLLAFADGNQVMPAGDSLADIPADHTVFAPPPSDAVLLFSDGQFELPDIAPQTWTVIDPALDHPTDAAVANLQYRDRLAVATVKVSQGQRDLIWTGATATDNSPITGNAIRTATPTASRQISARLSPGDLWPENDALSIQLPPPPKLERWWIGTRNPGAGWWTFSPGELPTAAMDYLNAAVIVLDNISADAFSAEQRDRIAQYARDLGGGVVIVGGDHAFAGGGYIGTQLDAISPLASAPPNPTTHWILLIDGSGSMADPTGNGATKWQAETTAITRLLPALPGDDLVSIGSFAQQLDWWSVAKSARDTARLPLPPTTASPRGPTNLQPALQQIIDSNNGSMPVQLLLMTDAETDLTNAEKMAAAMSAKKIHLHVLAVGQGDALPALRAIVTKTGGLVVEQLDPIKWTTSARQLLQSAMPDWLSHDKIDVHFVNQLSSRGHRITTLWNRTWIKPKATTLAESVAGAMAAQWRFGNGQVAAMAYPADIADIEKLAEVVSTSPRDPRFVVAWQSGPKLHVQVDAFDNGAYINGEQLTLELHDLSFDPVRTETAAIPQTGPGEYAVDIPAPRSAVVATVRKQDHILERFGVTRRYAPEFDAIGNNYANLRALAEQTSGGVVPPNDVQPINFHWPTKEIPLMSWLACIGAAMTAATAMRWRKLNY